MPKLNTKPGSSTPAQRKMIAISAKRRHLTIDDVRDLVGGKLHVLSCASAASLIERLTGEKMKNLPGQKPSPYKGRPSGIRLRTEGQVQQITRLGLQFFGNDEAEFDCWLFNNFETACPAQIDTAKRASHIAYTLKIMLKRKESTA